MQTIRDVVETVLPGGSNDDGDAWKEPCRWPPDLFAVAAVIAEHSGLYTDPIFTCWWVDGCIYEANFTSVAVVHGKQWREEGIVPCEVTKRWQGLLGNYGGCKVNRADEHSDAWMRIVFDLLAIADEACSNIGFADFGPKREVDKASEPARGYMPAALTYQEYAAFYADGGQLSEVADESRLLPYIPFSLCRRVPTKVRCVQPKTNVPAVGCTLRSLSHNLALLPPSGEVRLRWDVANAKHDTGQPLNLLVVPFPYVVPGQSFRTFKDEASKNDRTFQVNPLAWMHGATPGNFAEFIEGLVIEGRREVSDVHGVILPEVALPSRDFADEVAKQLAKLGLDLFVTGIVSDKDASGEARWRNLAATYRFADRKERFSSYQSKHHRWCLNGDQVKRYHLGHVLAPDIVGRLEPRRWWEQIDVSDREVCVSLIRSDASLCVLICEDLARYDPVLPVLNAIGPNLVVALLMDGPQLEQRWCGRYATSLAEDPGSSVLTVTSLGMVTRSTRSGEAPNRSVALWKDSTGTAQSLALPPDDHALVLTLTGTFVGQKTLDLRPDVRQTTRFVLSAVNSVRLRKPPEWLKHSPEGPGSKVGPAVDGEYLHEASAHKAVRGEPDCTRRTELAELLNRNIEQSNSPAFDPRVMQAYRELLRNGPPRQEP